MPHLVITEIKSMYKATVTIGHENIVKGTFLKVLSGVGTRSNGFKVQNVEEGTLCSTYSIIDANLGKDGSYNLSKSMQGDVHQKTGIKLQQLHVGLMDAMQSLGWRMINYKVDGSHQSREWTFEL